MIENVANYVKLVFSSDSGASSARWFTFFTVATGCFCFVFLVRVNKTLPDPGTIAAMAAWMVAPYAVNKAADAFRPDDHR